MNKYKKYVMIMCSIGLMLLLIGVTYSFFNYTRTGSANSLGTGRISFSTSQGEELTITNVFPMTATQAGNTTLDTVTVGIAGDTSYADGEEFEITLVDVTNTVNGKEIPMNYIATYTAATGGSIGASNSDYWEDREDKDANIYLLNATGLVTEGKQVLVGYIKNGSTGINGTLSISAYIDADRIAISDTYYKTAPTPTPTTPNDQYGTTTEWVHGRVVFTTEEWNSLTSNPISFKIKAESNEGIWVRGPLTMEEMCPDCVYAYNTEDFWITTWNTSNETPTVLTNADYEENYEDVINASGKDYFLGLKLNGNNQIEKVYSCGLYNGTTPFCIEGYYDDSKYVRNQEILQSENLWNNTCRLTRENSGYNDFDIYECINQPNELYAITDESGMTIVGITLGCGVTNDGWAICEIGL